MTVRASIQNIDSAIAQAHGAGDFHTPFDTVNVKSRDGGYIDLFLPSGTGKSVADAINAAVAPAVEVAA